MSIVDDRVLEYIEENEHGSPTEMKEEGPIRYSRQYIARRCKELEKHGLLKAVGNGVYVITDRGKAYLRGDLDTHEDAPEENINSEKESSSEASEKSNG